MSTPPRRRRPDARRPKPDGGGWLPTIAMGVGVIVAGLGIGVLVAVLTQRTGEKSAVLKPVAAVTSTPAMSGPSGSSRPPAGRRPVAIATLVPPRTPRPSPSPSASPDSSPAPTQPPPALDPGVAPSPSPAEARTATPAPQPTRAALANPDVAPTATPPRVAAVTPAPLPSPSPSPAEMAAPSAAPAAASPTGTSPAAVSAMTASPVATLPVRAAPSAPPSAVVSSYDDHASAVVRRYVDALIRGDEKTAHGAFGAAGGTLSEQAFLDPGAHIVSLKVTRIDASNASVGCEIAAAKGHYYVTYHVTAATGGPYISQHDYIKV